METPPLTQDDEEFLDRLFGEIVAHISEGRAVDLTSRAAGREHLRAHIRELEELAAQVAVRRAPVRPEVPGYEISRELGHGGMGEVYLARQLSLDRWVALKTLSVWRLASTNARERFAREARVVARLNHPHIVPIYDVGEAAGIPYFTMEYIEGSSLAAQLQDEKRRSALPGTKDGAAFEPLCRTVLQVAEALDHAHAQGIVHRDVKPSNILVRSDGRALLFDFGLARLESDTSLTQTGNFLGTPHYISPEQLAADGNGGDARSDIYSLGVTLFEMLTLCVPFSGSSTQRVLYEIQHSEPKPPRKLNPHIPRDLETICRTAMEKSPQLRYPSVAEFAADLQRFLAHRPILARPVGAFERTVRLIRRNRAVSAAVALALLLVLGTPSALWIQQRSALLRIESKVRTVEAIQKFLEMVFASVEPGTDGREVRVAQLLDRAVEDLERVLEAQPEVAASLCATLGQSYHALGLDEQAEQLARTGIRIANQKLDRKDVSRLACMNLLAIVLSAQYKFSEAEQLWLEALPLLEEVRGPQSSETLTAHENLAAAWLETDRPSLGIPVLERCLSARRREFGDRDRGTLNALVLLGLGFLRTGDAERAQTLIEEATSLAPLITKEHDRMRFTAARAHAYMLEQIGDLAGALQCYRDIVELERIHLGPTHRETLATLVDVATCAKHLFELDAAESACREAIEGYESTAGPHSLAALNARVVQAQILFAQGRTVQAEQLCLELKPQTVEKLGAAAGQTLALRATLALVLSDHGKSQEAVLEAEEIFEINREVHGERHPTTVYAMYNLGRILDRAGLVDRAVDVLEECKDLAQSLLPEIDKAITQECYGRALFHAERPTEAEAELLESLGILERLDLPTGHQAVRETIKTLIEVYRQIGDEDETRRYEVLLRQR